MKGERKAERDEMRKLRAELASFRTLMRLEVDWLKTCLTSEQERREDLEMSVRLMKEESKFVDLTEEGVKEEEKDDGNKENEVPEEEYIGSPISLGYPSDDEDKPALMIDVESKLRRVL